MVWGQTNNSKLIDLIFLQYKHFQLFEIASEVLGLINAIYQTNNLTVLHYDLLKSHYIFSVAFNLYLEFMSYRLLKAQPVN